MPTAQPSRSLLPTFSRQELALIVITMIWGSTFLIVQLAMQVSGPFFFVGLRFVSAGLLMLAVFGPLMRGLTRTELFGGVAIGASIFLGYFLQTYGLQTISSSKSAFITALYVPLVPILQWLVLRRPPGLWSWIGVALAFAGLVLLAGPEAGPIVFETGEIVTVLCAIAVAGEVILIGRYAGGRVDSRRITTVQLLVAGLLSFVLMPVAGEPLPEFSWFLALSGLGLGFTSAAIQFAMNWAQRSVSPTRATLIYAGEAVWAGIVGRIAGDRFPLLAFVGAALILAGVIVSQRKPGVPRAENPPS